MVLIRCLCIYVCVCVLTGNIFPGKCGLVVEPLLSAYKTLAAKLGHQTLPLKYLIGTVNFSFQTTKVRTKFPFKCLCQNGSKNKLSETIKVIVWWTDSTLQTHWPFQPLLASVIPLGVWVKQLKGNWGKQSFLGMVRRKDASTIAWSVQLTHTGQVSHYSFVPL